MSNELDFLKRNAERNAIELIDGVLHTYKRAVEELTRERLHLIAACKGNDKSNFRRTPQSVLSNVICAIQNCERNLRLDLFPDRACAFAVIEHMEETEEMEKDDD